MNATLHTGFRVPTPIDEAMATRRRLNDAIDVYGNGYDDLRASAIEAIASGRAAFWTTSNYSAARTVDLPLALNRGAGIRAALDEALPAWCANQRPVALDTIVPLNRRAAVALSGAYASFGIWRDEEELERRALRDCRRAVA
ncbi:hypothetical protein EOA79_02485 [Mesorhizobium sp. M1A.F.Ca.IN.020.03.2.1]|uniref:hypothetical protein n=1 Tax=Mesorhizobium sp. M1A.F.Ca.IN.020.03.2.1 TaxID=2496769 RepID=UPI000FD2270B|nr:hypothetical protein [Mesorhizobium sp. M1A.F.Ca.IN.020.03.2.1]RUV07975.1 hypothetical protein EOA79_02485 [Mesorhizobium sp. M1A.F.Ca.IN.020.03.2.1]